jgi:IS1 family transposase
MGMNKLPLAKRVQILTMLCEGSSMRSIGRVVDVSPNTVDKILIEAGNACAELHDEVIRNVKASRVQCDEIWSFTYAKQRNVPTAKKAPEWAGDTWTWTAIEAQSKLIISYLVGDRSGEAAMVLMDDLRSRLANRVQLTTDGHRAYLEAVEGAFGSDVDFAQLVKLYGATPTPPGRYSPAECVGARKTPIEGSPDLAHVSTSYVERANLTMRMQMRRFTRLTNGFSKKFENHCHMVSLYTAWYNLVRMHKTLRMSPAMAAGVTDRLWSMEDIIARMDANAPKPALGKRGPRGPYKKSAAKLAK